MLDYTQVAFKKTVDDLKRIQFGFTLTVQIAYIFYLIYAIAVGTGILAVNITLLALGAGYLAFFLALRRKGRDEKTLGRAVSIIYKSAKHLIKVFTLASAIASICIEKNEVTPFAILFVALMVVGFIIQVLIDVAVVMISARVDFFLEAIRADWEDIKRPVEDIQRKLTFWKKEEAPEPEKNKDRLLLDALVSEKRVTDAERKRQKKEKKTEVKKAKRKELSEKIFGKIRPKRAKKQEPHIPKLEDSKPAAFIAPSAQKEEESKQ